MKTHLKHLSSYFSATNIGEKRIVFQKSKETPKKGVERLEEQAKEHIDLTKILDTNKGTLEATTFDFPKEDNLEKTRIEIVDAIAKKLVVPDAVKPGELKALKDEINRRLAANSPGGYRETLKQQKEAGADKFKIEYDAERGWVLKAYRKAKKGETPTAAGVEIELKPRVAVKPKETKEKALTPEQKVLAEFKEAFPWLNATEYRLASETVSAKAEAEVKFSRANVVKISKDGHMRTLLYENTGARGAKAKVLDSHIVVALDKDSGVMTKYAYVELDIKGSLESAKRRGWIKLNHLKKNGKALETESEWTEEIDYTDETIPAGKTKALTSGVLYKDDGLMIRNVKEGNYLEVVDGKIRKIDENEYVKVKMETQGDTKEGWVPIDMVHVAPLARDLAFKEDAALIKQIDQQAQEKRELYYHPDRNGLITFPTREEMLTVGLVDLFPTYERNDGDQIEVIVRPFTKPRIATLDASQQEYFYDNGERAKIYDKSRVKPLWKESPEAKKPKDREVAKEVELKGDETYDALAVEALKIKEIADTGISTAAYAELLRKYQIDNTVFFIIPKKEDLPTVSPGERVARESQEKADEYRLEFKEKRSDAELRFRTRLGETMKAKYTVLPGLSRIISSERAWRAAWDGRESVEIAGLDRLKTILSHPVFARAGINQYNAREKIYKIVKTLYGRPRFKAPRRRVRDDEFTFEEVLDTMDLYRKENGEVGSLRDMVQEAWKQLNIADDNRDAYNKYMETYQEEADLIEYVDEQRTLARSQRKRLVPNFISAETYERYKKARDKTLARGKEYTAYRKFTKANDRATYIYDLMVQTSRLLDAMGSLTSKTFVEKVDKTPVSAGSRVAIRAFENIFRDTEKPSGRRTRINRWGRRKEIVRGTSMTWEDIMAGKGQKIEDTSYWSRLFDEEFPVLTLRDRLNEFQIMPDGSRIEHINEAAAVNELNILLEKGIRRLALLEGVDKKMVILKKYGKTTEEQINTLRINSLTDLDPASGIAEEQLKDIFTLLKVGFYMDERDRELGVGVEMLNEIEYSQNPVIASVQRKVALLLARAGVDQEKVQRAVNRAENRMIGAIGVKIDKNGVGLGVGTGIDLGEGLVLLVGIGIDTGTGTPYVGLGLRYGIETGKRKTVGLSAGPMAEISTKGINPALGGSVDWTFPIGETEDLSLIAGAGYGFLGFSAMGGVVLSGSREGAVQKAEREKMSELKIKAEDIEKEKDPVRKFQLIMSSPTLANIFKEVVADSKLSVYDKQTIVLRYYDHIKNQIRAQIEAETETPGLDLGIIRFTSIGIVGGVVDGVPIVGPVTTIETGRDVLVFRHATPETKARRKVSSTVLQAAQMDALAKEYKGKEIVDTKVELGESGDVIYSSSGELMTIEKRQKINLDELQPEADLDEINRALNQYDMEFVPEGDEGWLELKIYGALGNVEVHIDQGLKKQGLILDESGGTEKVMLAPGANPRLFISRELFRTPFTERGSHMNTIVTISDTPQRSTKEIREENMEAGAYLYRKRGDWEVMGRPSHNTMYLENFENFRDRYKFEGYVEKEKYTNEAYEAYAEGLDDIFRIQGKEEIDAQAEAVDSKALRALTARLEADKTFMTTYKSLTTLEPKETPEETKKNLQVLLQQINLEASKPRPEGIGRKLNHIETNMVLTDLMVKSFSELEAHEHKVARFKQVVEWSREAVLIPFFEEKIGVLKGRNIEIASTAEQLADYVTGKILAKGFDAQVTSSERKNFLSSVGTEDIIGMRGVPYYLAEKLGTDEGRGIRGYEERFADEGGVEGDLSKVILELVSPLETQDDLKFIESGLARRFYTMKALWVMLGHDLAMQFKNGVKELRTVGQVSEANRLGLDEVKKIVSKIREVQLSGGDILEYENIHGDVFTITLGTETGFGGHEICRNPSFAVQERIGVSVDIPEKDGIVMAKRLKSTATVTQSVQSVTKSFGLGAVFGLGPGGGGGKNKPRPGHEGKTEGEPLPDDENTKPRPRLRAPGADKVEPTLPERKEGPGI